MEQYWESRMELVSALKEGAASNSLATHVLKTKQSEGIFILDVEGTLPDEPKKKDLASASASTLRPIFPLSRYV